MNRMISKIALLSLLGLGLQVQANNSWFKGIAAVAGTIGAYSLYLRNQNIDVHQRIIEEPYLDLIKGIENSVKYNRRLDGQVVDQLEKLAIYPGAQLNARVQDHRNSQLIGLAKAYNGCTPVSKAQSEAGKKLTDKLTELRMSKLKECSNKKWKPFVYGSVSCALLAFVYGIEKYFFGPVISK